MLSHFTLRDIVCSLGAIVLFPVFVILPGYVMGWLLDLADFRVRTRLVRLLLGLTLSIALTPIVVYLLERGLSITAVWLFYSALSATLLGMIAVAKGRGESPFSGSFPPGAARTLVWISAGWIAVVVLSLVDLEWNGQLYPNVVSYDYTVRSATVGQLAHVDTLPAVNPFFYPGQPSPFRYHYFWFLICSLPDRLSHGLFSARHAIIAGVTWIGFAMMALAALYLRLFSEDGHLRIRRRTMLALGLMCISGLDIIPVLGRDAVHILRRRGDLFPSVDWWNADQVTGWLDSALWVPHHIAALIACMTGFLILWVEWQQAGKRIRWQSIAGASLAFASASGLSVYVTVVFAAFLSVWGIVVLLRGKYRALATLVLTGAATIVLALPFVLELAGAGSGGTVGANASFARLGVRVFTPAHIILHAIHRDAPLALALADGLMIPVNLLLELGAMLLVGVLKARELALVKRRLSASELAGVVIVSVTFLLSMFVRSNTIEANDLGMRGMLIVQFILLIWGADILADRQLAKQRTNYRGRSMVYGSLWILITIGLATNVYELILLRSYTIALDHGMHSDNNLISSGEHFGARTFAARQAYEWLDSRVPSAAIEQSDPFHSYDHAPGLYSNRQTALANRGAALAFGGNPMQVDSLEQSLGHVFADRTVTADIDSLCHEWNINYLIARSGDRIWADRSSWVWTREPIFSNGAARAFACGK